MKLGRSALSNAFQETSLYVQSYLCPAVDMSKSYTGYCEFGYEIPCHFFLEEYMDKMNEEDRALKGL